MTSISLNDFLLIANIRSTLEFIVTEANKLRSKVIYDKVKCDSPISIGSRFYELLKNRIVELSKEMPELGIGILNYEAFSFYVFHRAFEVRYCRDTTYNIPSKRFSKVGLSKQGDLFEEDISSDLMIEMENRHFYIVFLAQAMMELNSVSLNEYIDKSVVDSVDFTYVISGCHPSVALVDESAAIKPAVEIASAADELGLVGEAEISLKSEEF